MRFDVVFGIDPPLQRILESLNFNLLQRITSLEYRMSALSDKIAEVKTAFDAAVARNQADDRANKAKIAELQALVDSGGATPQDLADLDALKAIADGLDATSPTVLPAPAAATTRRR